MKEKNMKTKANLIRVLTALLLLCLLCGCGASQREWIPVNTKAAARAQSPTAGNDAAALPTAQESAQPEGNAASESGTPDAAAHTQTTAAAQTESDDPHPSPTAASSEPHPSTAAPTERLSETEVVPIPDETESEHASPPDRAHSAEPAQTESGQEKITYVANTNSKKFHSPGCSSVTDMKASNRWDFTGTREELIAMGYEPCKRCKP